MIRMIRAARGWKERTGLRSPLFGANPAIIERAGAPHSPAVEYAAQSYSGPHAKATPPDSRSTDEDDRRVGKPQPLRGRVSVGRTRHGTTIHDSEKVHSILMEEKARLTILIDPDKKKAFEELCSSQDMNSSQVVRLLIRRYLEQHGVEAAPQEIEARKA